MKEKVLNLRPTQFAVGMLEVDEKIKEVSAYSEKQLKKYIKSNVVPVVRGHDNELYVVDKHHFLTVCYSLGIKKVHVEIIKDMKDENLSYEEFWEWMVDNRNSYPYCQFGEGPREALYLPHDVRGLADDPYRSIAWFVRKTGAYENSNRNFSEFQWANFFRSKKLLQKHGKKGLPEALVEAVKLAQSDEARDLPGFDKLNFSQKEEAKEKAYEKGEEILQKIDDKDIPQHVQ